VARRSRQLGFQFRTWGGARPGAGRPPKGKTAGVSHLRRPSLSRHHPLHVTLRVQRGIASLRGRSLFAVVRRALAAGKAQFGFSLVHFSVQRDHLHLIAEAKDRRALARGVQGLSIRVARAVNRQLERTGRLFADRYHARALKTPRSVRMALRYVLLNVRKHTRAPQGSAGDLVERRAAASRAPQGSAGEDALPVGFVDPCSSAPWFGGFSRPAELAFGARAARDEWACSSGSSEPPVASARSWLLARAALQPGSFDVDEVPGSD
jgi:putative transposase